MFKLDDNASIHGTHLIAYVTMIPSELVKRFGEPKESDGYKVSGEYVFTSDHGRVFTLYDWKSTNLYDDKDAISPKELWASKEPFQFNIGGNSTAGLSDFQDFLGARITTSDQAFLDWSWEFRGTK